MKGDTTAILKVYWEKHARRKYEIFCQTFVDRTPEIKKVEDELHRLYQLTYKRPESHCEIFGPSDNP